MKMLLIILFCYSISGHSAPLNMKPGLWQVDMKIKMDGKEYDPMAELNKSMANIPKEQRDSILKKMGKTANTNMVCYSEKMIKDPESMNDHKKSDCDFKTSTSTASKVVSHFTCKDGAKGDALWEAKNPQNLTMKMNTIDKNGKKTQMDYQAKFIATDCGELKPLIQ